LKNSLAEKWPKKLGVRKPYKRLSRFPRHFLFPNLQLFLGKMEFFNSQACYRQLGTNGAKEKPPETERQFCAG